MTTMKAVAHDRYGSPDVLRVENVPRPVPGKKEVLVRIRAASVNTADLDNLAGKPWLARIGTGLRRPRNRVPGIDIAGEVEAVGPGVSLFGVGDQVWADLFPSGLGAFAEYVCASEKAFLPKPPHIPFDQAATVPHSGLLALQALRCKGLISPGDEVVINGGGGCVGPFAIQIAKSAGAVVTGVDHGGKLDLMRSVGADHVIDYTKVDFTRNGHRYDFIVDIASNRMLFVFKRALKANGRYVQIARGLFGFFQAALLGVFIGGSRRMGVFMWVPNKPEDMASLGQLIETGHVKPVVDRTYRLSETSDALEYVANGQARGKVALY